MKKILFLAVVSFTLMSAGGCSSAVGQTVSNTTIENIDNSAPISMRLVKAISYAYDDYPQSKKNESCLVMSYRENEEYIFVSIYSKPEIKISKSDDIIVSSGQGNKCGPHFSYKFDENGIFLKKTGIR